MDAGLQIDIDKCEFETKRVKYLGYIVEAEVGIQVDPEKVVAIREWATPTTVKAVRAFIGFANFYRVFIPEFSDLAQPLINLTKKEAVFHWDAACDQAFESIRELLVTAPILGHFDPERETLVEADSSGYATGGLLLQKDKDNNWQPVAYYSKKHSATEANYPIHDKELLAIVRCLEAWAPELHMVKKFTVLTDHKNLQYFYRERQLSERQVPDKERNLPTILQKEKAVSIAECTLDERGLLRFRDRIWIPDCEPLRTQIIQNIHDSHITGHPGRDLTYTILSRQFFWSGAASDVRRFVRNCEICGRNTIWRDTKRGLLKPLPIPERIWGEISIDFITDLPPSGRDNATNCMVVTDRLTKGVELEGLHDISAEAVAQRLFERHYPIHGIPTAITSDRGPQFVCDLWRHFCKLLDIEQRLSTAYHPQTDGATERMNQEIEKMIRIWATYTQENWLALLPIVIGAINNREASSTGLSPFFFMHGYHNEPIQLVEERTIQNRPKKDGEVLAESFLQRLQDATEWAQAAIAMTQEKQQYQANKARTAAPRYKEGDWVFLNLRNVKTTRPSKKLDWLHGKYQVMRQVNSHSYQLNVPGKIHPVFHVDLLRYAPNDPLPSQKVGDTQPGPILVDGEEVWLVERVLDERTIKQGRKGSKEAYVKWVDYTEPTWEPVSNVLKTDAWKKWIKLRAKKKGGG
ncbi:hypothetical protein PtrM4_057390 [Pyrenophora tritici-repentis]|uniref:Uncharacterized protein n=1 Tax=Pyrenophora tritici-repentis TaxID=45151 RepID=A0A834VRE3_9PLEO|nr:hypothetical protein PtrM4_057390 [Pyrenophora tritici-repentis]